MEHGIQLLDSCDAEEALVCTTTSNRLEYEMAAGDEVLVVVDGASDIEQVFNLSINEVDNASFEALPSDTSAIDTSGWTEEVQLSCASLGSEKRYSWTAPSTGTVVFDLSGSDFDSEIAIKETDCAAEELACDDDGAGGYSYYSGFAISPEK